MTIKIIFKKIHSCIWHVTAIIVLLQQSIDIVWPWKKIWVYHSQHTKQRKFPKVAHLLLRIRWRPLWMTKSLALGGALANLRQMWVRVSSWTPVGEARRGSLPSKKPDHGESIQCLLNTRVSILAAAKASSRIFSYLSLTSWWCKKVVTWKM